MSKALDFFSRATSPMEVAPVAQAKNLLLAFDVLHFLTVRIQSIESAPHI